MNKELDTYKLCKKCKIKLKKRKTYPYTAHSINKVYYDYYQCSKCKTNYSYSKS